MNKFSDELLKDLGNLLSSESNCDVIIEAGEDENKKNFHVHSLILISRSSYFKAALSNNWARKENDKIIFKKPNIDPKIMELLLKYIYIGKIDLDKQRTSEILKYFVASDELNFRKLNKYIENYIIEKNVDFLFENPVEVLQALSLTGLRDFHLKLICDNPEILFESSSFSTIDKSLLISLIQRDDLNMEEHQIWEYVLEWGVAQMLDFININDLSNWTRENFIELEGILRDFIPLIRWVQIPPKFFHQRITPFKQIFPENMYDDIVGYFMDPDSPPKSSLLLQPREPTFKIINKKRFATISNWIDNKGEFQDLKHNNYYLELLYSATRDGFDSTKFHKLCDYKGPTLMVVKIKDTGKLIGGYNPNCWNLDKISDDSFLFCFDNNGTPTIARCLTDYGPYYVRRDPNHINLFGLIIKNNTIKCDYARPFFRANSFIKAGQEFMMEDYEVFKVIKLRKLVNSDKFDLMVNYITQGCVKISNILIGKLDTPQQKFNKFIILIITIILFSICCLCSTFINNQVITIFKFSANFIITIIKFFTNLSFKFISTLIITTINTLIDFFFLILYLSFAAIIFILMAYIF